VPLVRRGARALARHRSSLVLGAVFVLAFLFYLWTAATSIPLTFHNGGVDRYNLLASAFLHLRLSIGPAPAGLVHLAEPYNPVQNGQFVNRGVNDATNLHDDVLYGGRLYFLWGPAPALVFLVPMHLLGFEPSGSVTVVFFATVGLGFALATLRVLLRQIGHVPLWSCALAACALALCSAMPFLLRTPSVTEDTIAGGLAFTMIGVWLAVSALAVRQASLTRLALMSLCFGLAAGSRAPLAITAVVLIAVYLGLRSSRGRRGLLMALILPVGICFLLLLAYNQARFGAPLEFGSRHQLSGVDSMRVQLSSLSYVVPGTWFYTLSPPRPLALFPFLALTPNPVSYPSSLPLQYQTPEATGGLLAMTPILILLPALPWIVRRRPTWLGPLGAPLLTIALAGIGVLLLLSYGVSATTERYEVDFATLLLIGALAAWLTLFCRTRGIVRRLTGYGGGLLVAWGCLTGLAISFVGYGNYLAVRHPGTWSTLENVGASLSAAIAGVAGRPVLSEVTTSHTFGAAPALDYTDLGKGSSEFWFGEDEQTSITIVSPDTRTAALLLTIFPGLYHTDDPLIRPATRPMAMAVRGSRQAPADYLVAAAGQGLRVPLRLGPGINRFELVPIEVRADVYEASSTTSPVLVVTQLSLESHS
jgi:hypothetical protein